MIDHVHALPEGYRLQEYTITGTLGFGGFGITYSALDTNLDKIVAIKEYLPGELAARVDGSTVSAKSEQDKESFDWGLDAFLNEAKTVAKFDHPNIVRIHRFFKQNGTGYIVMEFIEGRTLSSVLKEQGALDESEIRVWLWPVMDGLKIVHKAGYLHRDIKPQNIMMRKDGRPCLLDFGAARMAMGGMTRSLTAIMTPGFAPLEQYETKGNQGPWTDIYALGAVMYGCIAGHKPKDALDRIRNDALETPESGSKRTYSQGLLRGITIALSMQESDRPQNIDALLKILDAPEESTLIMTETPEAQSSVVATMRKPKKPEPTPPRPSPAPKPPKHKHVDVESEKSEASESKGIGEWLVIALLPILIIAFGVYWWMGDREDSLSNQASIAQAEQNPETVEQKLQSKPSNEAYSIQVQREPEQAVQKPVSEPSVEPLYEGINVRSDPPGASIFVDNEFVGVTPVNLQSFEAGRTARIRLQLEGYEPKQQIVTAPNTGSGDVSLILQKVVQKYALTIEPEPADAKVMILNIKSRYQPGLLVEPGRYQVEVSKIGFVAQKRWIQISDRNVTKRITIEKESPRATVSSLNDDQILLPSSAQLCKMPTAPPPIPKFPSKADLLRAQKNVKQFQAEMEVFRTCINRDIESDKLSPGNKQAINNAHNYSVDMEERVARLFNDAVREYKNR